MTNNGWIFNINRDVPNSFQKACSQGSTWYGYSPFTVGTVTANFTGAGTATLDYGNCYSAGEVKVYLNGELKDVANKNMPSKKLNFDFSPNDVLELKEFDDSGQNGIIKLNSLNLDCKGKVCFSMDKLAHRTNYHHQIVSKMI